MSQLVEKLEASGAIVRQRDASTDELMLTGFGHDLVSILRPRQETFLASCFTVLDDDELRQLKQIVERLTAG